MLMFTAMLHSISLLKLEEYRPGTSADWKALAGVLSDPAR
jgi:hypothetical protein